MANVARRHTSQLDKIKQSVEQSYTYFRPNYERFHQFMRFVYKSTLTEDDIAVLATLGRPQIEFNMMEAYISRLRGEFSITNPCGYGRIIIYQLEQFLRHLSMCQRYHRAHGSHYW